MTEVEITDAELAELYGLADFELYGAVGWAHAACELGEFCRNPLHPGPCKGWKHMLHGVAPGAYHAYEQSRVKQLNEKRKARIAELEAAGKKVPAYLKKEITYAQVPKAPPGTPYHVPSPVEAAKALPPTSKEIGDTLKIKHELADLAKKKAAQETQKAAQLKLAHTAANTLFEVAQALDLPGVQKSYLAKSLEDATAKLEPGGYLAGVPSVAATVKSVVAHVGAKAEDAGVDLNEQDLKAIGAHLTDQLNLGLPGVPKSFTDAMNEIKDAKSKPAPTLGELLAKHDEAGYASASMKLKAFETATPEQIQALSAADRKKLHSLVDDLMQSNPDQAKAFQQKLDKVEADLAKAAASAAAGVKEKLTAHQAADNSVKGGDSQHHPLAQGAYTAWNISLGIGDPNYTPKAAGPSKAQSQYWGEASAKEQSEMASSLSKALTDNVTKKLYNEIGDNVPRSTVSALQADFKDVIQGNLSAPKPGSMLETAQTYLSHGHSAEVYKKALTTLIGHTPAEGPAAVSGPLAHPDMMHVVDLLKVPNVTKAEWTKALAAPGVKAEEYKKLAPEVQQAIANKTVEFHDVAKPAFIHTAAPHGKLTKTGGTLGTHGAYKAADEQGKHFVVKPATASSSFTHEAEKGAAELAKAVGLPAPEHFEITPEGESIQSVIPGAEAFPGKHFDPSKLSASEILDVQKHQVLDWLIGNHDAHGGQFIKTSGGLAEVDKAQAFKHFGKDKLSPDYHPNSAFGESEPIYNTLNKAAKAGKIHLFPIDSGSLPTFIKKVQAIPDDQLRKMFLPYAKAAQEAGKLPTGTTVDGFLNKLVSRKNNLMDDFQKLYVDLGQFDPDAHEVPVAVHLPSGPKAQKIEDDAAQLVDILADAGADPGEQIAKIHELNAGPKSVALLAPMHKQTLSDLVMLAKEMFGDVGDEMAKGLGIDKGSTAPPAPVGPHVTQAITFAHQGGYKSAKKILEHYAPLTQQEYHGLHLTTQQKIHDQLQAATAKLLGPKKGQTQALLDKLGMPLETPHGAGAGGGTPDPLEIPGHVASEPAQTIEKFHSVPTPISPTGTPAERAAAHHAGFKAAAILGGGSGSSSQSTAAVFEQKIKGGYLATQVAGAAKAVTNTWMANKSAALGNLKPAQKALVEFRVQDEVEYMIMSGSTKPPAGGLLEAVAKGEPGETILAKLGIVFEPSKEAAGLTHETNAKVVPHPHPAMSYSQGVSQQVVPHGHATAITAYNAKIAKATKATLALDSAPLSISKLATMSGGGKSMNGVPISKIKSAFHSYSGSQYIDINGLLRREAKGEQIGPTFEKANRPLIKAMDAGFAHSALPNDTMVFRGIRKGELAFGEHWSTDKSMVGSVFSDPGYASSSVNIGTASGFSGTGGIVMRILLSKGTPAVNLVGGQHSAENELLLPRGSKYRIVADNGWQNGQRHLDVELIL